VTFVFGHIAARQRCGAKRRARRWIGFFADEVAMNRNVVGGMLVAGLGLATLALFARGPALLAQEKTEKEKESKEGEAKPVNLTVIVPQDDATLWINDTETKQKGDQRKFVSSPLKPGKDYYYALKVLWEPNNYTKIYRSRKVSVQPGGSYTIDLTKQEAKDPKDDIVVRYVPTPDEIVDRMCAKDMGNVGKDDIVFDLGCGDGRMVCRAVSQFNAKRGVGVDIDPERVKDSKETAKKYKVEDRVTFREGDVLKPIEDLPEATVILIYMGDDIGARLGPILQKTLKPGARVVSHRFTLGDWKPDKTIQVKDSEGEEYDLHLWTIPEGKTEKKPDDKTKAKE
jgi:uncharacterized protein (TIGR03000 family)